MDSKFQPMLEDFAEEITRCIEKYSTKIAAPEPVEQPHRVASLVPQVAT
jgi:hypothetical protein